MPGLRIRKLAEEADGPLPRPLAGVRLEDAPDVVRVSTKVVAAGVAEGWVTLVGERVVHRPSGPAADPWGAPAHTFRHADAVVFHTLDGDVTYRVTHQPDKYADYGQATFPDAVGEFTGDDDTPVTSEVYAAGATRVDWFYDMEKEG